MRLALVSGLDRVVVLDALPHRDTRRDADGVVCAVNQAARRAGVAVGQSATEAAWRMLLGGT